MRDYLGFVRANPRFLAFGFALTFFSSFGQTFFISLFGGEIRESFGLDHGGFGLLYSVATLASGLTMIRLGRAIDRTDLRRFSVRVAAGLIAACLAMAAVPARALLVPALFAMRLTGQGLMSHTSMTSMARYFDAGRGKALAIATLGFPAGEALLPPLAVALKDAIGWRATWLAVAGALAVLLIPLILLLLRGHEERHRAWEADRDRERTAAADATARRHFTRGEVLRDPRFLLAAPAIVTPAFLLTGFFFHQVHLVEEKGWDLAGYALSFSGFAAAQLASTLLSGPLVDRHGATRLLPFFLVPLALSLLVLATSDVRATSLAYLALAGLTAGSGATIGGALWAEVWGTAHLGAIRAMVSALFVLSTAASPVLMGALLDGGVSVEALARLALAWTALAATGGAIAFR